MRTLLLLLLSLTVYFADAQQREAAESLVDEGVKYHDKEDYTAAIAKYDKALEIDKDNLRALTEKSYSFLAQKKYTSAISCCERALETHPGDKGLKYVYINCGTAWDGLDSVDRAVSVYDQGIKQFPKSYLLYFNKGIALHGARRYDEAALCFQQSARLNPKHASSHNALGRIAYMNNRRIPALLSFCRLLILEQQSPRAKEDFDDLQKIVKGNVEKTGKKSITITYNPNLGADSLVDNFNTIDLLLSMESAMDYDKKNKKKSEVELFISKMESVCSMLTETSKKENQGFCWHYYAPYFAEMHKKKLVETFGYIAFSASDDASVKKWIKEHSADIERFYNWSNTFVWDE